MPKGMYKRTERHRRRMSHGIRLAWRSRRSRKRLLRAVRRNVREATRVSASLPRTAKQLAASRKEKTKAELQALRRASRKGRKKIRSLRKKKNGICWICRKRSFVYKDHNHKTGKKRGKLCLNCNLGIGNFRDDPKILKRAILYLKRFR